ncbi:enoyl-CoA hydratase/isomerase family protein [bacterium]|nr:enoyl-CoA hydratase/isomerase family protein [bacterium]
MAQFTTILLEVNEKGVATVTLNRPDVHNAFDATMIIELTKAADLLEKDPAVHLVVLRGAGKSFCAGGDMNWLRDVKAFTPEESEADSQRLARLFDHWQQLSRPVIGVAQGASLGGGTGLVSICDYVLADANATFGLTEARLGLVPAVISPYVMAKIGPSHARALFTSGIRISADRARAIGLVHEVASHGLEDRVDMIINEYLKCGPQAMRHAKHLVGELLKLAPHGHDSVQRHTIRLITELRQSAEAQEGLDAALAKRAPAWVKP